MPITSVAVSASATGIGNEAGAAVSGNAVEFVAKALEDNPTQFQTWLDTCSLADNTASNVVRSISYSDDQNRNVDVASELERMGFFDDVRSSDLKGRLPLPQETREVARGVWQAFQIL